MRFNTWRQALACLASACLLAACGGGGSDNDSNTADAGTAMAAAGGGDAGAVYVPQAAAAAAPGRAGAKQGFSRYIVEFRSDVDNPSAQARGLAAAHGGDVVHSYSHALKGFAVVLPDAAADAFVEAMQHNPHVDHVEVDQVVTRTAVQGNPAWGLDRVDQRDLPLNASYSYSGTGSGVRAYIIDSGIRATHADFGSRVLPGYTAIGDGWGTNDCHGHGTHVAGTVGGATWGMAKGVSLVPVRVLGCDGTGLISGIIAGIDWMVANAPRPAVANMSIGAGASSSFDSAVNNAAAAGITIAVAAGNSNVDACTTSPARATAAITVGATTSTDARASYSNWGTCLDIFAPGSSITSAGIASDTATQVMSGTSMATPHVAGMAALYLQNNPAATPAQVTAALKSAATPNKVTGAGSGSVNALLYAMLDPVVVQPDPTPVITTTPVSVGWMQASAMRLTGKSWRATVTVAAKNSSGAAVPGVLVTGGFTYGGSAVGCTTGSSGTCVLSSGSISTSIVQTRYTVSRLSGTNMAYDAAGNAVTSVPVYRP
ncbi:MAG: S8 family peptidase [Pseudomonadota bacterium]